jgi:ADP-ribosylglycohydrolase
MLPADHELRMDRARLSLDGLSIGDAFGERFFTPELAVALVECRAELLPAPWGTTDDTEMAIEVVENLRVHGRIERDPLAHAFALRHARRPARGYGSGARQVLRAIASGTPWSEAARRLFGGQGSLGNGAAMRVAPLGAYFGAELNLVAAQAVRSAEVTHAHPEGQAGAIAVAVAAAWAASGGLEEASMLFAAHAHTPESATRAGLHRAMDLPPETPVAAAAAILGAGERVSAADTVPFALWCTARHPDDFEKALWATVSGMGDRDTTCAIVGGIVALTVGRQGLPSAWLEAREPLC